MSEPRVFVELHHAFEGPLRSCEHCGETDEHKALIAKPGWFIANCKAITTLDNGRLVCLDCLAIEIEELKHIE